MSAKIIAIGNQKGGVGKTVSTYNMAASLARAGKMVLMIDMDPQYSLTLGCNMLPDAEEYNGMSTCSLYEKKTDPLDCCFTVDVMNSTNIFIIPSSQKLAVTERKLSSIKGAYQIFKNHIEKLRDYFDFIFLDCPPTLAELLISSLIAADGVIIPVIPDRLSYGVVGDMLTTVKEVQKKQNEKLEILGFIATLYNSRDQIHKEYIELIDKEQKLLGIVPKAASVSKSIDMGLPVVVAHPQTKASKEYKRISYGLLG